MKKLLLIGSLIISSLTRVCGTDDAFSASSLPVNHLVLTNGFFNFISFKHIVNLPKIYKKFKKEDITQDTCCGSNSANLALCHLLWQLARVGFQWSREINTNKKWFVNIKFYSFDYGIHNRYIEKCTKSEFFTQKLKNDWNRKANKKVDYSPTHICIIQRISWGSLCGGIEYKYFSNDAYSLCWSWAAGFSFATSKIPDLLLVYTPLILYTQSGFFCRLQLIQLSILNLASTISYMSDDTNTVNLAHDGSTSYHKTIKESIKEIYTSKSFFVDSLWRSILSNITLEIGYDFQFFVKSISNKVL